MRAMICSTNVIGMDSPSLEPCASATAQLLVAMAFAPASRIDFAVPASHALYSSSGAPLTWSSENRAAFSTWFTSLPLLRHPGDKAAPAAAASTLLQGFMPLLEYVASQ